ncbi:hypothetical protein EW146_g8721 [Bondarzewia mesenterica]|uniref:Rad60/SUMO-like domain-containing protein n=1 Tax=Bondarzewia mesenterica TaxID=1095465 RepID=A0A4S4LCA2_9AGAM|nr:hypothetical protein EW146_g8721 [Bondarzewia mesenterica]
MSRPRPRPRPRPAHRQESVTNSASSISKSLLTDETGGLPSTRAKSVRELELDREDTFFIKNRNRTAKEWKRLDQMEKGTLAQSITFQVLKTPLPPLCARDANLEIMQTNTVMNCPNGPGRKARRECFLIPMRNINFGQALAEAGNSDDEVEVVDGPSSNVVDGKSNHADQSRNAKKARSRSRSLTPPPKLSIQQIQNARNVVRQALESAPRPASPTQIYADDSADIAILDPELVSIARAVEKQAQFASFAERSNTPDRGGGPEVVQIKVKWCPHPLNQAAKPEVWGFKMNRHDAFSLVFDEVADIAGVLAENLILSYEGGRVYASATPHSLKIWAEAEMEASDKATFEYMREQRKQRRSVPPDHAAKKGRSPSRNPGGESDSDSGEESRSQTVEDKDDTFKLVVRSATTKDVTLTVRSTTTCGAIVKAFLRRAGLADKYPEGKSRRKSGAGGPRLMIDGDRIDPEVQISEAELEDGDQVEVVNL